MGNIVIYGLCGEKRRAKGQQDKAVFGGALGCHVSAHDTRDSASRITVRGIDVRKRPPYLPRALTLRGAQRLE